MQSNGSTASSTSLGDVEIPRHPLVAKNSTSSIVTVESGLSPEHFFMVGDAAPSSPRGGRESNVGGTQQEALEDGMEDVRGDGHGTRIGIFAMSKLTRGKSSVGSYKAIGNDVNGS